MDIQEYISSGVVEAYVLGLATVEEVQEIENLRKQHPALDAAITDFEISLEQQGMQQAAAPPPNLKESIWEKIESASSVETSKITADPIVESKVPLVPLRSKAWNWVAAAALVGFLATGSYSVFLYSKYQKLATNFAALQKENTAEKLRFNSLYAGVIKMQETNFRKVVLPGVKGHENDLVTVYYDTQNGDVYLLPVRLPETPANRQYQLWAIVDGKPVDAGLLNENCTTLCKLKNIKNPQAFAITLEKQGGSDVPTLSEMVVMGAI
ncbi:MAG: anti-sigma factor [Chitinophagaceae bacterium]|nr:anti-sigma factor [Chitinophagaceae bacterium]